MTNFVLLRSTVVFSFFVSGSGSDRGGSGSGSKITASASLLKSHRSALVAFHSKLIGRSDVFSDLSQTYYFKGRCNRSFNSA